MRFKDFLLVESGFGDSGSDWFYGGSLYPSDAFDWADTCQHPGDFLLLQKRWEKEKNLWKRKFHNIKLDDVLKTKYTSIRSNTMPDAADGFWKHRKSDRPNVVVDFDAKMQIVGYGKTADNSKLLKPVTSDFDKTKELNRLFGKFEPQYSELSPDFDKPWIHKPDRVRKPKKYPKVLNNFG